MPLTTYLDPRDSHRQHVLTFINSFCVWPPYPTRLSETKVPTFEYLSRAYACKYMACACIHAHTYPKTHTLPEELADRYSLLASLDIGLVTGNIVLVPLQVLEFPTRPGEQCLSPSQSLIPPSLCMRAQEHAFEFWVYARVP